MLIPCGLYKEGNCAYVSIYIVLRVISVSSYSIRFAKSLLTLSLYVIILAVVTDLLTIVRIGRSRLTIHRLLALHVHDCLQRFQLLCDLGQLHIQLLQVKRKFSRRL